MMKDIYNEDFVRGRQNMVEVKDYRIIVSGDGYTPPEAQSFHLQGHVVAGEDGKNFLTSSSIRDCYADDDGCQVMVTRSGSHYKLVGLPAEKNAYTVREGGQYFSDLTEAIRERSDIWMRTLGLA